MSSFSELHVGPWRLRPLTPADAEAWLAVVLEPELRRLTSWSVDTLDGMQQLIASYREGPRAQTTRRWAILDQAGSFAGTCGFKDWDRAAGTAELAYELALAHRRRGAMSTIAAAVLEHGFAQMHLQCVRALVMVENVASQRVLEKLGFARTATLPALRRCGGALRDFYAYERRST